MAIQPTNCYLCHNTYYSPGPICDNCLSKGSAGINAAPFSCSFCRGAHDEADCLAAAIAAQTAQYAPNYISTTYKARLANMASKTNPYYKPVRRSKPFTNYYSYDSSPPLKFCAKCNQHTCVETKAGSVCTNCKYLVRNPCRNCNSTATHGIGGDGLQFIECNDCQFIE